MDKRPQDRIEDIIEFLADIISQKSQDKKAVFLEKGILPPVAPVCIRV